MLRMRVSGFVCDEFGGGTIWGLLWFMLLVGICGLAVDSTDGFRNRTMLQATADSAALAAVIDLPDANAVVATAVTYASDNMETDAYGDVLHPGDVTVGTWDKATSTFTPGGLLPDAVFVQLHQTDENNNAVPVNFLRIVGLQSWNVNAQAIAVKYIPECLRDGLIARGMVDISSNNGFVNRICVHGQQGVAMQNHNFYEAGVTVSMPDVDGMLTIPSGGMSSNPGLPQALREQSFDPRMVNHVDEIMLSFLNLNSPHQPSYITDSDGDGTDDDGAQVIVVDEKFNLANAEPGNVYHVQCKPNKNVAIPSNSTVHGVVIIAECEIKINAGAYVYDAVLGSRSGGNGNINKANVGVAANVELGAPDNCAIGGGVQIFSNATIHTAASTIINGVQMVATGDVELGAADMGINGISVQTGEDITLTSNNMFGLCSGGAPDLFTVDYYKLVL